MHLDGSNKIILQTKHVILIKPTVENNVHLFLNVHRFLLKDKKNNPILTFIQ
jgi:hypothetical protein